MPTLLKPNWDALAEQFNAADFIPHDPISLPHRFLTSPDWRDAECVAFIAALFSYGRRDKILETLHRMITPLEKSPVSALLERSPRELTSQTRGFYYRFNVQSDLVFLLCRLGEVYRSQGSLKALWQESYGETADLKTAISQFRQAFLYGGHIQPAETYGLKFLFADPLQGSAAKRFNMFLRWVVRHDAVDLGLWADIMQPSALIFPLDTHVAAMARKYGITHRQSNDWKTAEEITAYFRRRCPTDPVRYDFALFGLGLEQSALGIKQK